MAGHGGARKGAGRKPGKVSAAKRELSDMAKDHAEAALNTLVKILASDEEAASARVSAANAILDRGYGKPHQTSDVNNKHDLVDPLKELMDQVARKGRRIHDD